MDALKINQDKSCFGARTLLKNFDTIRSATGILCHREGLVVMLKWISEGSPKLGRYGPLLDSVVVLGGYILLLFTQ